MCGIVGIVGSGTNQGFNSTSSRIIDSLYRLEYRGYDSAGLATTQDGTLEVRRVVGKIINLENEVKAKPISGFTGIGHTRWATHGAPAAHNAHPIKVNGVCVVHNGIIENHKQLREQLSQEGYEFTSETDTEVIPCLISSLMKKGCSELEAAIEASKILEGAYALAIIFSSNDNLMIGMKKGSPLAIGLGKDEMYLGSDALALSPFTNEVVYMEDGDIAVLDNKSYKIFDTSGAQRAREPRIVSSGSSSVGKDGHEHFMYKEIFEQPQVLSNVFNNYYDTEKHEFKFSQVAVDLNRIKRIYVIACGTSYYSAAVAKYWFERFARIPVEIDIASEYRYRSAIIEPNSLSIFISQSGETADTLWALKYANMQHKSYNIALVNTVESSIAHAANAVLPVHAGYEIGVASTKAFTAQVTALSLLCLYMCQQRKSLTDDAIRFHLNEIHNVNDKAHEVLKLDNQLLGIAKKIKDSQSMIYVGRDVSYPVALEGALKMKEITYIHAEGMAAGELKHGPIALIDENLPIIAIAPTDDLFNKIASNIHEMETRKGQIITFTDSAGFDVVSGISQDVVKVPGTSIFTSPTIYTIALQLLSYHTANELGRDVDQPRNLAKSVTVE